MKSSFVEMLKKSCRRHPVLSMGLFAGSAGFGAGFFAARSDLKWPGNSRQIKIIPVKVLPVPHQEVLVSGDEFHIYDYALRTKIGCSATQEDAYNIILEDIRKTYPNTRERCYVIYKGEMSETNRYIWYGNVLGACQMAHANGPDGREEFTLFWARKIIESGMAKPASDTEPPRRAAP